MNNINFEQITRFYPEIKIPTQRHLAYYINALERGGIKVRDKIMQYEDCLATHGDVKEYARATMYKIIESLKDVPQAQPPKNEFAQKNAPAKDSTRYVSVDLVEANWTAFKLATDHHSYLGWKDFIKANFGVHDFLANSKYFRQITMGNLNPKNQQAWMKYTISLLLERTPARLKEKIVTVATDEIIFESDDLELEKELVKAYMDPAYERVGFEIKVRDYLLSTVTTYEEIVTIKWFSINKEEPVKSDRMLYRCPGNRFFMNFKLAILEEKIDPRDLIFELDGHMASWEYLSISDISSRFS